jgi:predicted RNA binding protein YcfA (HicA-like mRNA interferase family)
VDIHIRFIEISIKNGRTMTKREITKLLKKAGFEKHEGGRHEVWKKKGFPLIPIPRHAGDIPKGTAAKIIKAAGIK